MSVIRFPPYADLRRPAPPTLWQRISGWLNPPPKAEVFQIKNPRIELARRRRERVEQRARGL